MYPDVQDFGNAVGPIDDGFIDDGLFVDGLFIEGLFVDGLAVVGFVVDGFVVDGFAVDGLVDDGFVVDDLVDDGFVVDGLFVDGLVCSARVVITFSSVFTSSTRTEARLFDLFLNKPTSASCSRLGVTSVVSCSERRIVDAYRRTKYEIS